MPARHTIEDEVINYDGEDHVNPEADGVCGVCFGQGEVPDINAMSSGRMEALEPCWNCGGDGVSIREGSVPCKNNDIGLE